MSMKKVEEKPERLKWLMWGVIGIVVLGLWWLAPNQEIWHGWIERAGLWGPVVAILLYTLLSLTPIPSDPLTIVTTVLYGPMVGFLVSWIGNNCAAMTEYLIAKDVKHAFKVEVHKLPEWLQKVPVNSGWFLIGARMMPVVGGKTVAIMAGIYKVSWWRFLWTTMIANLVGSTMWVLGGVGIINWL